MRRRIALLREVCRLRHVLGGVLLIGLIVLTALPAQVQDSGTVRFAAFGDFGKAGPGELEVANLVKSWDPDFIIVLGDNNYELGQASTMDANIGQYYREFIYPYVGTYGPGGIENRFFPALGNHDWGDGFVQPPSIQAHLDYFDLPGNERYYDFVKGPVHLFVIDSDFHEPDGIRSDSIQAEWLRQRLAASTSPWKIVYFHHAPYSSAPRPPDAYMRWPFREWGATAVLSGHHHHYESILVTNTPYFISGLGGNGNGDLSFPTEGSRVRYRSTLGAMRVTATETRLLFEFVATTGAVADSYAIDAPAAAGAAHNLVATGVPTGRIDLWWSDSAADETGFTIERSDDGVNFFEVANVDPNVTNYTDLTVSATPTTYRYRVLAQVPGLQAYSNVALGSTVPEPPDAPTATATPANTTQVRVSWTDVAGDAGYNIYRLVQGAFYAIGSVDAATYQFTDTGRTPGSSYTYVVRAVNAGGESPSSAEATTTLGRLSTPTNLTAVALSSKDIGLAWTDNSTGENYFKVLRSADGVGFAVVAWVPANGTSYVDGGRQANTTYWYRVQAYETGGGVSDFSNTASATTLAVGTAPTPASGLVATPLSTTQVGLTWSDNSTNELGFRIERAKPGNSFSVTATVPAGATSHTDGGLQESTAYQYRIIAYNSDGNATPSNVASVTTLSSLSAPASLVATVQSSTKVLLNWVDTTTTEAGFKVYRAKAGEAFSLLGTSPANTPTYTNGSALPGTTYEYRVVAYTSSGAASPPSNVVTVTTPALPTSPESLTATANSPTQVTLTWADRSNDETHFKVDRSTNGGSYGTIAWVAANLTAFVDKGRNSGVTYSYRVSSYNANGTSAPSNIATVTTP